MTLVFLCSPHNSGITDQLGLAAAEGAGGARTIKLAQYSFSGCCACGFCQNNPGVCSLPPDDAEMLYSQLCEAEAVIFSAPVYFYSLPGQFKLFIDRSQRFWHSSVFPSAHKKAGIILTAGRSRGRKLFDGSLLTLKWFLKPFGFEITATALFRDTDRTGVTGEMKDNAFMLGKTVARNK